MRNGTGRGRRGQRQEEERRGRQTEIAEKGSLAHMQLTEERGYMQLAE